jgi:hypothetical protein
MTEVVAYTVREQINGVSLLTGLYLARANAESVMKLQAEEFCIDRMGSLNFVKNQLEDAAITARIRDGYVLKMIDGQIQITRRTPSYFTGYSEVIACTFDILPIRCGKSAVFFEEQKTIVHQNNVNVLGFINSLNKSSKEVTGVIPLPRGESKENLETEDPVEKILTPVEALHVELKRVVEEKWIERRRSTSEIVDPSPVSEEVTSDIELVLEETPKVKDTEHPIYKALLESIHDHRAIFTVDITNEEWETTRIEFWTFAFDDNNRLVTIGRTPDDIFSDDRVKSFDYDPEKQTEKGLVFSGTLDESTYQVNLTDLKDSVIEGTIYQEVGASSYHSKVRIDTNSQWFPAEDSQPKHYAWMDYTCPEKSVEPVREKND